MPLSIRVGDRHITRLAEDVTLSRGLHGPAALNVKFRAPITRQMFAKFEKCWVYDHKAQTVWEGRLEDPGRSIDGEGQVWSMSAIGESARAADRTVTRIYIDGDLGRWDDWKLKGAVGANASATTLPTDDAIDCLLAQAPTGHPVDNSFAAGMKYRAIRLAGQEVARIAWTEVAGGPLAYNFRLRSDNDVSTPATVSSNPWSETPQPRTATIGGALPAGQLVLLLDMQRTGGAGNVSNDNHWAAFYDVAVQAIRYHADGTKNVTTADYVGDYVLAHEVVNDMLGDVLTAYDGASADVDSGATYQITQLAYPDGVTAEQLFADLMELEPDYYWQIGPSNASGKPTFTWRKWPTHVRYEASMRDGLDLPGNDSDLYNRVTIRWKDPRGRTKTSVYTSTVPELDAAGLTREPEIQDLSDEVGSQANADKRAAEFLAEHATPPVAGTLTVARPIYDHDLGRMVQPYEIEPGHLLRVRELGTSAADLSASGRDGKCVFRVTGMEYSASGNNARVELDAPPKTNESDVAHLLKKRTRKR